MSGVRQIAREEDEEDHLDDGLPRFRSPTAAPIRPLTFSSIQNECRLLIHRPQSLADVGGSRLTSPAVHHLVTGSTQKRERRPAFPQDALVAYV
jgi:hypothetical protein